MTDADERESDEYTELAKSENYDSADKWPYLVRWVVFVYLHAVAGTLTMDRLTWLTLVSANLEHKEVLADATKIFLTHITDLKPISATRDPDQALETDLETETDDLYVYDTDNAITSAALPGVVKSFAANPDVKHIIAAVFLVLDRLRDADATATFTHDFVDAGIFAASGASSPEAGRVVRYMFFQLCSKNNIEVLNKIRDALAAHHHNLLIDNMCRVLDVIASSRKISGTNTASTALRKSRATHVPANPDLVAPETNPLHSVGLASSAVSPRNGHKTPHPNPQKLHSVSPEAAAQASLTRLLHSSNELATDDNIVTELEKIKERILNLYNIAVNTSKKNPADSSLSSHISALTVYVEKLYGELFAKNKNALFKGKSNASAKLNEMAKIIIKCLQQCKSLLKSAETDPLRTKIDELTNAYNGHT